MGFILNVALSPENKIRAVAGHRIRPTGKGGIGGQNLPEAYTHRADIVIASPVEVPGFQPLPGSKGLENAGREKGGIIILAAECEQYGEPFSRMDHQGKIH